MSPALRARFRDSATRHAWEMHMKFFVIAGIMLFVSVGAANAQSLAGVSGIGGSSINNAGSVNNSGSINFESRSSSGSSASNAGATRSVAGTNPGEFVPSTFEAYDKALDQGQEAARIRPISLAGAARLAQKAKAAGAMKPAMVLEKNAEGKLIVIQAEPQR